MTSSWGWACNFDENNNLMSVLSGRSSIPGRQPYAGFSRPEYYAPIHRLDGTNGARKRKAISDTPRNDSYYHKMSEIKDKESSNDVKTVLLKPSNIMEWESQNPVDRSSQFPGHKLRKDLQRKIKEGKC